MSIRHAILALVSHGAHHGYAIRTKLNLLLGDFWPINQGQIYATLARMATSGAIEALGQLSDDTGELRPYVIRPAGKRAFDVWLERPARPHATSELLAKLGFLVRAGNLAGARRLIAAERARCESATRSLRRA